MRKKATISYDPLWKTMRNRGITTYELTVKRHFNKGTLYRLQQGENVNLSTIAELCEILECGIEDVVQIDLDCEK
ncbi:helix-turn-helix transcriptional regulator [Anaerovorax odorimutans]|uniref:Helix-turn-helix transcriptional regulator n=1 Tax=Anaerovorax odorimutans TaxID=109327 RepID=A0ABT1RTG4_9FIRM|nr:helix-turn-helix transcriptional regulator [Anaerovorax odorimutans]MCQ4638477.1 helix-turn-helix transcriptional regulator [Anaerovorax odorimutans]